MRLLIVRLGFVKSVVLVTALAALFSDALTVIGALLLNEPPRNFTHPLIFAQLVPAS
jgi:hypothetical protein